MRHRNSVEISLSRSRILIGSLGHNRHASMGSDGEADYGGVRVHPAQGVKRTRRRRSDRTTPRFVAPVLQGDGLNVMLLKARVDESKSYLARPLMPWFDPKTCRSVGLTMASLHSTLGKPDDGSSSTKGEPATRLMLPALASMRVDLNHTLHPAACDREIAAGIVPGKIDHHLQIRDPQDSLLTGDAEFRWGRCAAREARRAVWQRAH